MALPEDLFRGSSIAAGPLEEVSSGPSKSEISWLPLQTGSASHTCSSRGSNTPKPPTTFTTSCREGHTHESCGRGDNKGCSSKDLHSFQERHKIKTKHQTLMSQFTTLCPVSLPSYWWLGDKSWHIWLLKALRKIKKKKTISLIY